MQDFLTLLAGQVERSLLSREACWQTIDMHTAGEPLRVFVSGFPVLAGSSILAKRADAKANYDHLRTILMYEPRGHADMYGAWLVASERENSDFGVLFLHNEGYSTMCGHAIIALTQLALSCGYKTTGEWLRIDTPAGQVQSVSYGDYAEFLNVPSFVYQLALQVSYHGQVYRFDLAYGGAYYAFIDADEYGLSLAMDNHATLKTLGRALKAAIADAYPISHSGDEALGFLYGVIFTSTTQCDKAHHSRQVCIFADGELDRSPTGTGVSARVAILAAKGTLLPQQEIRIESILGCPFSVSYSVPQDDPTGRTVLPKVAGTAYITGQHTFYRDPADPLSQGFIFK
ncbi:proline racemase family protein [Pseudoalteromonas fenneropenaei]|uniref:Proline racemase family protein n=1 Tax=Pseudoalteromonas fenneropenaei TaxID=1737459 RepID=A0ABV7CFQ0_9GAMM